MCFARTPLLLLLYMYIQCDIAFARSARTYSGGRRRFDGRYAGRSRGPLGRQVRGALAGRFRFNSLNRGRADLYGRRRRGDVLFFTPFKSYAAAAAANRIGVTAPPPARYTTDGINRRHTRTRTRAAR